MEYYRCFDLEPKWNLDVQELERRFYALSRALHPDRYGRGGPQERRAAVHASARLNDAYRVLKDPIARAEYLLQQLGVDGQESPEMLEEVFELNLALEELKCEADPGKLAAARHRFEGLRDQAVRDLAANFETYDRTGCRESLEEVRSLLTRRKYLTNLLKELAPEERR
jgi:molecular chaperone HscB